MGKKNNNGESKSSNKRFQPHFRKFHDKKTTGHPQYVYDEHGQEYKVLGITKSSSTNGVLNVKLECNPDPDNNETAYVRSHPDTINKGVRNEKLKGWRFTKNDKKKVRNIIDADSKKDKK